MSKRKREPDNLWQFIKKRGLTAPGYKYLGPFNSLDKGEPVNKSDKAALKHDKAYGELQRRGVNPYFTYNDADEEFIDEVGDDWGGVIARGIFLGKRKLAKLKILPSDHAPKKKKAVHHSTIDPVSDKRIKATVKTPGTTTDNPVTMAGPTTPGQGSGLEAGLKETPIDKVNPYEVYRGPPDYTFASLPYHLDALMDITNTSCRDHAFRMTSPLDPQVTYGLIDVNAGTGEQRVVGPLADASDSTVRSANWFSYYSGLYNFYHVISCQYKIFVENYGDPIWVYQMFYNEDLPNGYATNLDMQLWPNTNYWYVNASYIGIGASGQRLGQPLMETTTNSLAETENDEDGMGGTGTNPADVDNASIISYSQGKNTLVIQGEYRPGDFTREIRLDSQVENWTAIGSNPALPERLLIRVKPQSNVIESNSTRSAGDDMRYRIRVHINYLVEFKELKADLRYPVVNQPLTVNIANAQVGKS